MKLEGEYLLQRYLVSDAKDSKDPQHYKELAEKGNLDAKALMAFARSDKAEAMLLKSDTKHEMLPVVLAAYQEFFPYIIDLVGILPNGMSVITSKDDTHRLDRFADLKHDGNESSWAAYFLGKFCQSELPYNKGKEQQLAKFAMWFYTEAQKANPNSEVARKAKEGLKEIEKRIAAMEMEAKNAQQAKREEEMKKGYQGPPGGATWLQRSAMATTASSAASSFTSAVVLASSSAGANPPSKLLKPASPG